MAAATRIYIGFVVFVVFLGSALVLPKMAVGNETGLAAGGTAAVTFLGLGLVTLVVALTLLVMTIRQRHTLPAGAKLAGFLPVPLLLAGALVMVTLVRQKQAERRQNEPSPGTLTPTAPITAP
jgi:hypothetical protein